MEILKFRAWDEENKVMEYGISINDGKAVKKGYHWFSPQNTVYHAEIMQYTGFTDEEGNDIYKSDLLQDKENFLWEVIYKGGCFFIYNIDIPSDIIPLYQLPAIDGYKIKFLKNIGNIYEH